MPIIYCPNYKGGFFFFNTNQFQYILLFSLPLLQVDKLTYINLEMKSGELEASGFSRARWVRVLHVWPGFRVSWGKPAGGAAQEATGARSLQTHVSLGQRGLSTPSLPRPRQAGNRQ